MVQRVLYDLHLFGQMDDEKLLHLNEQLLRIQELDLLPDAAELLDGGYIEVGETPSAALALDFEHPSVDVDIAQNQLGQVGHHFRLLEDAGGVG